MSPAVVKGTRGVVQSLANDTPARDSSRYAQVESTFAKWLPGTDMLATGAMLLAQAANLHLDGVAVWLVIQGGSGAGKTERALTLANLPGTVIAREISGPAAFLAVKPAPLAETSGEKETGGLLPQVGENGSIIVYDFTSVLTLSGDKRGQVISALRHIYDGEYIRSLGAYGGVTLEWKGRCGFIACVTDAIDKAYGVVSDLGTRWVNVRVPTPSPIIQIRRAMSNNHNEVLMQSELKASVHELLMSDIQEPYPQTEEILNELTFLSIFVAKARSPIFRDRRGDIELIPEPEVPTRLAKQLIQMYQAAGVIGMPIDVTRKIIHKVGMDSIPRVRGTVLAVLTDAAGPLTSATVASSGEQPPRSVDRALADLAAHGLVRNSAGRGAKGQWQLTDAAREWLGLSGAANALAKLCTTPRVPPAESPAESPADTSPAPIRRNRKAPVRKGE